METEAQLRRRMQECLRRAEVVGLVDLETKRNNPILNRANRSYADGKMNLCRVFQIMDLARTETWFRRIEADYESYFVILYA
jgi:hypothetical protein